MRVIATWEFEADVEKFDGRFVDQSGLAKELTYKEMEYLLTHRQIKADDFQYEIVDLPWPE